MAALASVVVPVLFGSFGAFAFAALVLVADAFFLAELSELLELWQPASASTAANMTVFLFSIRSLW